MLDLIQTNFAEDFLYDLSLPGWVKQSRSNEILWLPRHPFGWLVLASTYDFFAGDFRLNALSQLLGECDFLLLTQWDTVMLTLLTLIGLLHIMNVITFFDWMDT